MRGKDEKGSAPEDALQAASIRRLTGLSDRQLHEWDKRGAFTHERQEGGQRKVTVWDAMALKIASAIRTRYSIPVTKLGALVRWMTGRERSGAHASIMMLCGDYIPTTQSQADFFGELVALAGDPPPGLEILKQLPRLHEEADALDGPDLNPFVHRLAGALVPLYQAMGEMTTGFPTYLISNLESHQLVGEPWMMELIRAEAVPPDPLIIRVDEHINEALRLAGGKGFPVRHREQDIEPAPGESLEEKERQVLEVLRQRDFQSMTISPFNDGYRMEISRDLPVSQAEEIERLIESHDYQSILVKRRHGKVQRLTQTESITTSDSADGKTLHRDPKSERPRDA